jgi:signal transduction histidine kinase
MKPLRARPDWGVWSDLAAVATLTIGTAWLSARFEWMETLYIWTRAREQFQLDELIPVLLVLAAGLVWFAARRYRQARRAADARRAAQAELAQALAAQRRLAQQVVRLQEDERKSLARELHDETGQYLNAIKLDAVTVRDAGGDVPDAVRESARAIVRGVDHVQASVSSLIRQLRPVGLDELGLAAAVEHCVNGWRARLAATRFEVSIDPGIDARGTRTRAASRSGWPVHPRPMLRRARCRSRSGITGSARPPLRRRARRRAVWAWPGCANASPRWEAVCRCKASRAAFACRPASRGAGKWRRCRELAPARSAGR